MTTCSKSNKQKETPVNIRKTLVGAMLAAGLATAGMLGAATASAVGYSYDNSDIDPINVGTGATSDIKGTNNQGLAVSVFAPAHVSAGSGTDGNRLVAVDGLSTVSGDADNNRVFTAYGVTALGGNSDGNIIANVGGVVSNQGGNSTNAVSASVCGTPLTGEYNNLAVSGAVCG